MDIEKIYQQQKLELTDHFIYLELAGLTEDKENAKILREIAAQELEHYYFWKNVTGKEAIPDQRRIKKYRHRQNLWFIIRIAFYGTKRSGRQ